MWTAKRGEKKEEFLYIESDRRSLVSHRIVQASGQVSRGNCVQVGMIVGTEIE